MFGTMMNRAETFGAYNEHISEMCKMGKGRLFPVMVPNYWDPSQAKASVERCKELGARCLMVPIKPGNDVDDEAPENPAQLNPKMDPALRGHRRLLASRFVLPHRRGGVTTGTAGAAGTFVLTQMQGFRNIWEDS